MKRKTKLLFNTCRPGTAAHSGPITTHSLGRQFRAGLSELDRHPQERRIHGEVPGAVRDGKKQPEVEYLLSRAEGRWGRAVRRPVRKGKTAKDHRTGAHAARFSNRAARVEWQHSNTATNATFPGGRA